MIHWDVSVALMLALCTPNCCCLCKVCSDVSEALILVICVRLCSCMCIVCSNVSEAFMLVICVRFCSCLCKVCSRVSSSRYSRCGLCLSLSFTNSSSDSKAFLSFIAFSGSPTAVHRTFLFFDAKAWPQSQTDFFKCTTVIHCGHTFLRRIDLLHSIACTSVLH